MRTWVQCGTTPIHTTQMRAGRQQWRQEEDKIITQNIYLPQKWINTQMIDYIIQQGAITEEDVHFLWRMSYVAVFSRRTPVPETLIQRLPECIPWVQQWGRKGDGVVFAVADGLQLGAAWYRSFSRGQAVPGLLDEQTPVLAIAVLAKYRRCGIGGALLAALKQYAQDAHFSTLSLSVGNANAEAIRMYERHGFQTSCEHTHHRVMCVFLEERK